MIPLHLPSAHTRFHCISLLLLSIKIDLRAIMNRSYNRPVDSPSFSSSLLDRVFRSIDETDKPTYSRVRGGTGGGSATKKSQAKDSVDSDKFETYRSSMEKKRKKFGTHRRNFETEATGGKPERYGMALRTDRNDIMVTTSIRIDSIRGGLVSTSYDQAELKPQPTALIGVKNLKPIRTSTAASRPETQSCVYSDSSRKVNEIRRREGSRNSSKPKPEAPSPSSSFQNAKCRAAKMYGDLKNVKCPISPGGKLTRFITSLFYNRNSRNKPEKVREHERGGGAEALQTTHVPITSCSSASTYYRSCLSNESPASSKRSVQFYPVNILIDDEDGHQQQRRCNPRLVPSTKSFRQEQNFKQSRKCDSVGENCRSQGQSDLRELLKKYNKNEVVNIFDKLGDEDRHDGGGDDGGNSDGGSCASSDLFELDHIRGSARAVNDELPVYETTQFLSKNLAICHISY